MENNRLKVEFDEGVVKIYDVTRLYDEWPVFKTLEGSGEFYKVHVDMGGYGIAWNEKIDLDCNELWENGTETVPD
ncbi:MAG: DUF2442 domain-containing protein [Clostridia bacterium]|nr:DUF2442 domain-containing protein [Clostridia bacterium]